MSVLRHVIDSITPASAAHAEGARLHAKAAGTPILERLAARLGAAQHAPRPRAERRTIVVVAGDHGAGDPGIAMGASHPTVIAARAIADGTAALAQVARAAHAPMLLVDAGAADRAAMPAIAVQLGRGATRDLLREPAMTVVDASLALEAGIALAVSLVDQGLDVLAVGAIGIGSEVSAAALLGASGTSTAPTSIAPTSTAPTSTAPNEANTDLDAGAAEALAKGRARANADGLELLATFGGPETGVLAGAMLACASMNVPVLLDGEATCAAALVAARLAPAVTGYLVATHGGPRRMLAVLGLEPVFDVGLGHGEGTGAAMVIPLVDQVAALVRAG
jgi:nicotinate-nucleotide--dimethylbenzimidazole phosphoribosyltransferase